jgi:two-component system LytT family sensor kinase
MRENDIRSGHYRWIWIASIWLGFGLVNALETVLVMHSEGMHHAWPTLFATVVVSWLPWALATSLVLHLGRRFPVHRPQDFRLWRVHLPACVAIALLYSAWTAGLQVLFNPYADPSPAPFFHLLRNKFFDGMLSSLVLYATILSIGYVLDSRERLARHKTETAQLNEQLSKAQLAALRRQIEPHFLFNTLNSVAGLVREGRNDAAISMIVGLSDLLRRLLQDPTRQQVPLREEMDFARKYLDLQKMRFADRLHIDVDVPDELYPAQVPSLLLQPMVENAVLHGIAKRAQGGAIRIAASRSNGTLTLSVSNDGPSLPANWETAGPGIGISNVRTRLKSLYGDVSDLCVRNRQAGGVEVSIALPFVVAAPAREV